jgi:hypothetical protein
MANSSIDRVTPNTLIQPKVCPDGRYPLDFSTPTTLSDLARFSESQLDRLLEEYEISFHRQSSYGSRGRDFDSASTSSSSAHKMASLLDFLGAHQLADVLRTGSGSDWSSSRRWTGGARR